MNSLIGVRFLSLVSHLGVAIFILGSTDANVRACLPLDFTDEQYSVTSLELTIGLFLVIVFIVIEFIGFMSYTILHANAQCLLSIGTHAIATIVLSVYFMIPLSCGVFWAIFTFCSLIPLMTEMITVIHVVWRGKHS